jgi:hypothetical protein
MESDLPVDINVPTPPAPVGADGSQVLAYEIHVTDFRALDLTLAHLAIFDAGDTAKPLVEYPRDSLAAMAWHPGVPADTANTLLLHGGQRMVIFVWLKLPLTQPAPRALTHRLTFAFTDSKGNQVERAVEGGMTPVVGAPRATYAWPAHAGEWLVANGPGADSDHRRAMHALDGRTYVAQRFAVDLMPLGSNGRLWHTDPSRNENWYGYGQEVLAVADGEVVQVVDSVPENTPLSPTRAVRMARATICGNYVVLKLGEAEYTLYAHLKPGGIKVKPGERVKRGDVLGYIGNTGNSDAPHLHFHAMSGPSPLASEGIPYVFPQFTILSVLAASDLDAMLSTGKAPSPPQPPLEPIRNHEMPKGNMVLGVP